MVREGMFRVKVLGVSSVLMFVSIFSLMPKVIGIFMTMWVCCVAWNIKYMSALSGLGVSDFTAHITKQVCESKAKKKYVQMGFFASVIPMMCIGMVWVIVLLITLFTLI